MALEVAVTVSWEVSEPLLGQPFHPGPAKVSGAPTCRFGLLNLQRGHLSEGRNA
jgi:hypothetical protein